MNDDRASRRISLSELQEANLASISAIVSEIDGLLGDQLAESDEVTHTLRALVHYLSGRSQAVSMLVSWGYVWDAEIILRSFYETTAKIVYICLSDVSKRKALATEFWLDFEAIHARKTARIAEFPEKLFKKTDSASSAVFSALRDPKFFNPDDKRSKSERKAIEQRWSFSEIIESLSKLPDGEYALGDIKVLLHMYGMASHLIHADKTAMDLMTDRALRGPAERLILEASHAGRVLSDQTSLWFFCADAIRRHLGKQFQNPKGLWLSFDKVQDLGRPLSQMFSESQREFYERLGHLPPSDSCQDGTP
ncbi:DUF5677 domain-containing protein [Mesorhizobium sp. M0058]|uniref:DUF5677 domain-containing protein n=1 Tax=Mesorhizobium sp. M0058 TaxID=2956865 RepID=UPI00333E15B0